MVNGMGGGVSSEIMGGRFEDGFKVAFLTAAAAYAYNSVSSNYNTNNGEAHMWQNGKSDVGKILEDTELSAIKIGFMKVPFSSDQSAFMKWIGKNIPYADAFAEFHDGFHDLPIVSGDQLSLIVTMPPSYALTVTAAYQPYTNTYFISEDLNRNYR